VWKGHTSAAEEAGPDACPFKDTQQQSQTQMASSAHSDSCCVYARVFNDAGVLVPPSAEQRPKQLTEHNDARHDKYYWYV